MKRQNVLVLIMVVTISLSLGGATATLASDITVTGHTIDLSTGGDWRGIYGECFYLLPDPHSDGIEEPLDPASNVCVGGSLESVIDWDLFGGDPALPENVFVWSLASPSEPESGAAQWNPCEDAFKAATFDNGDYAQTEGIYNPLTNQLIVDYDGCLTVSYYFAEAITVCRELQYSFYANGDPMESGLISDLDSGKYLVLDVCGLVGTTTFELDVQNTHGDYDFSEVCGGYDNYPNAHLSGVFVSNCEQDEVGTGTPGYFKKAKHWPEGVDGLEIGGERFSKAEAIEYLKMNKAKGNKCLTMFNALVAANLNVYNGAQSWCVDDTIDAADDWFEDYCAGKDLASNPLPASNPAWGMIGEPLSWTLDDYNNGRLCAPHRD